jgi:hypothetical protein
MVVVFNLLGLAMFVVASAIGSAIAHVFGISSVGFAMIFSGPVLVLIDIGYRKARKASMIWRGGGSMMFLPAWFWGFMLIVLGVLRIKRGY